MTKAICFYNDGTLDHRAFTMLGLSAKSDDKAIGFFGTGFKYAIATLLRCGCEITVHVHSKDNTFDEYKFFSIQGHFRDKEVEFIYYSDGKRNHELPFTTHLGANWKLWQAYRELYTNALDEGGGVELVDDIHCFNPAIGDVCVYVVGDEFIRVYEQHAKYFLKAETVAQTYCMRCVEKVPDSENVIYYKTMFTGTKLDKPSHLTYDYIQTVELTEDRTIADTWSLRHHISRIWLEGMDYNTLVQHLPAIANEKMYENQLSADYCTPSDDFNRACAYLNQHHRSMPLWARDAYNLSRPFDEQVEHFKPNRWQRTQLKRAVAILHHNGSMIDPATITTCASLPEDVIGLYKNGTIYITKEAFERGFLALLGTLYEEYTHLTTGYEDGTNRLQNLLVDKVANLMQQVYEMDKDVETEGSE